MKTLTLIFAGCLVAYFAIAQVFLGGRAIGPLTNPGQLTDSNTFYFTPSNTTQSVIRAMPWPVLKSNIQAQLIAATSNALQTGIDGKQPLDSDLTRASIDGILSYLATNDVSGGAVTGFSIIYGTNMNIRGTNVNGLFKLYLSSIPDGNDGAGAATGILPGITNYGPYVLPLQKTLGIIDLASTNSWTFTTATNFEFAFTGTPRHGQLVSLMVSNPNPATRIIGTNLGGIYDVYARSNRTTWEFESNSITSLLLGWDTNFDNGGKWLLMRWAGPEYGLEASGGVLLETNGATRIITAKVNPNLSLSNLTVTNNLEVLDTITTDALVTGSANVGNQQVMNVIVTNRITYRAPALVLSGNSTQYAGNFSIAVNVIDLTNCFHLTGMVNIASANLVEPWLLIGRNITSSNNTVSVDPTMQRAGTNFAVIAAGKRFRLSVAADGTGGVNPTNFLADIQPYDSP